MTTVHAAPVIRPAQATACAWFPADTVTSPRALSPGESDITLFSAPRNYWQVEHAVISMLAGDVFDYPAVLRRLRIFRFIYAMTAIRMAPQALRGWLRRKRQVGVDFRGDTLQQGNP